MIKLTELLKEIKTPKYTIFCDLDGVLVDFDKGYLELTGKPTHHAYVQDSILFWRNFKDSLQAKKMREVEYWANLDWMSDGRELWSYIKPYTPYMLTAPSRDDQSKEGKTMWVNQHLTGFKSIIFKLAKYKSDLSKPGRILIDDRADTIERWNNNGGIGILHTSATNTIEQLKQLGL
jgi:hypothetical protein